MMKNLKLHFFAKQIIYTEEIFYNGFIANILNNYRNENT